MEKQSECHLCVCVCSLYTVYSVNEHSRRFLTRTHTHLALRVRGSVGPALHHTDTQRSKHRQYTPHTYL